MLVPRRPRLTAILLLATAFTWLLSVAWPSQARAADRPLVAIMIGEPEYQTSETLPEFAKRFLQPDYRIEYVLEDPAREGVFRNLEAIPRADVLIVSVRRKTPPEQQLNVVREFVAAGKPVIGIRTASHAFSLRNQSPAPGTTQWPGFDAEVFGGNYTGHHANDLATTVSWVDSASNHPIAAGIAGKTLRQTGSLYKTSPLADGAEVMLVGDDDGEEIQPEPVAWTFVRPDGGRSFYTSLGHPTDFENPFFQTLLRQAVAWAADRSKD